MKITACQLNPTVGDIEGNIAKLKAAVINESAKRTDLVIFSELYICGYPPMDLLDKRWFIKRCLKGIEEVIEFSKKFPKIGILFGAPTLTNKDFGRGLFNSALLVNDGNIIFQQNKSLLPTYDVFDEARYFDPADSINIVEFKGKKIGISICEDAWNVEELWPRKLYNIDPIETLAKLGADILVNISASPFFIGKEEIRFKIVKSHVEKYKVPFIFVNQVGGNDELIFDGRSILLRKDLKPYRVFSSFQEEVFTFDINDDIFEPYFPENKIETLYNALKLGIKDYLKKCGFKKVVIGLSGGIDSAVTCSLAVASLGKDNVLGVLMPGPFSSEGSVKDSIKLAENLGIDYKIISIKEVFNSYLKTLQPHFKDKPPDITEENLQARIRGNILMAISNKFGHLVLSTGNKSELAVGYCTLYGDMSGGLAVISDVPKVMVYELAEFINKDNEIIPKEIIKKPPSAELRPEQKDEDSLPPYEILDKILQYYIEEGFSEEEIIDLGFNSDTVRWVIKTVNRNEYKRKQAAPGLKVTSKAFGIGRRMPIAAKY